MLPSTRFGLALVLAASLQAACGGKSFDADPDQGGSDPGGTGQGGSSQGGSAPKAGSAHGGSVGKGGSSPGGTGQGGSAGSACSSFDDHFGSYIPVEIHNQTTTPIFLGQAEVNCSVSPLYDVDDSLGNPLPRPSSCSPTCQSGPVGCPAICAFPTSIALQPGEVFYTSWDGLFLQQIELPTACVADPGYGNTCQQALAIQPGKFTFSALAGTSIDCSQTTGFSMCQACTFSGEGGCSTPGSLIAGKLLQASTTVLLDASYGVYGSQPTPAPAPADPIPGGNAAPSGAMAYTAVQIIFSN